MRDQRYINRGQAGWHQHNYVDAGMQSYEEYQAHYDPFRYNAADWQGFSLAEILSHYRGLYQRSIYQVAEDLRIRAAYLHALEAGQFDSLPGVTYASGFVRTYATYLGLPAEEMVQRFKYEARGQFEPQQSLKPNQLTTAIAQHSKPVKSSKAPQGIALVACMAVIAASFGGWWLMSPKGIEITHAPDGTALIVDHRAGTTTRMESLGGGTNDPDLPLTLGPDLEVNSVTELMAELERMDPEPRSNVDIAPLDASSLNSVTGMQLLSAAPAATASVIIRAKRLTWVQIRDLRGNQVASEVLQEGQDYAVPQLPNLNLVSSELDALDVFVDGEAVSNLRAMDANGVIFSLDARDLKAGVAEAS